MRKTIESLLTWGKSHHYPYLRLDDGGCVKHGELTWRRMTKDRRRRSLAWKRIERWQELVTEQSA